MPERSIHSLIPFKRWDTLESNRLTEKRSRWIDEAQILCSHGAAKHTLFQELTRPLEFRRRRKTGASERSGQHDRYL